MTKRLEILENSLKKKKVILDEKFKDYFDTVSQANGQPLNDKRNGASTMASWDKKSDAIANQKKEVEKTENAIDREKTKINNVDFWYNKMPEYLTDLIDAGTIKQWGRHPRILFVGGVDHARLVFDDKSGLVKYRYLNEITDKDQYATFRDVVNEIHNHQQG